MTTNPAGSNPHSLSPIRMVVGRVPARGQVENTAGRVNGAAANVLVNTQRSGTPPRQRGQGLGSTEPQVQSVAARVTAVAQNQDVGGAGGHVNVQQPGSQQTGGAPIQPTNNPSTGAPLPQQHVGLQPVNPLHTGLQPVASPKAYLQMKTVTGVAEIAEESLKKHQETINAGFTTFREVVCRAHVGAKDVGIDVIQRTVSYELNGNKVVKNLDAFLAEIAPSSADHALAKEAVTKLEDAVCAIWNDRTRSKEQVLGSIRDVLSQPPTAFVRHAAEEKKLPGCGCVDKQGNWDSGAVKAVMERVYHAYMQEIEKDPVVTDKNGAAATALESMDQGLRALKALQAEGKKRREEVEKELQAKPEPSDTKKAELKKELEALDKAEEQLQQLDLLTLCSSLVYAKAFMPGSTTEMETAIARAKKSQALLQGLVEKERQQLKDYRSEHWIRGGFKEGVNKIPLVGRLVNPYEMPDEVALSAYAVDAGGAVFGSLSEPMRTLAYTQYLQDSKATVPLRARSIEEGIVELVMQVPAQPVAQLAGQPAGSVPAPVPCQLLSTAFRQLFKGTQVSVSDGGASVKDAAKLASLVQILAKHPTASKGGFNWKQHSDHALEVISGVV